MKKLLVIVVFAAMAVPLWAVDGAATYTAKCVACHGADGTKQIPALGVKALNTPEVKKMGTAGVASMITKGRAKMPAFGGKLSAEEISAVAAYVLTLK